MAPGYFSLDSLRGVHVLLVDHDRLGRELLASILEYGGALVTAAASGEEALRLLHLIKPDVLITALALPGGDGYWLIRQVRALKPEDGATVPAIAVGAGTRGGEREEALARGFEAHLRKPLDPWHFCRVIVDLTIGR